MVVEKLRNIKPENLIRGDKIGPYLEFAGMMSPYDGYLIKQLTGNQKLVWLNWKTVNWLIQTAGVTRNAK